MESDVKRYWALKLEDLTFESGSRRCFLVNGQDISIEFAQNLRVWIGNSDRNRLSQTKNFQKMNFFQVLVKNFNEFEK